VAALTTEQVWQGSAAFQTLPAAGGALEVVSNIASDNSTGTGAREVDVLYLTVRLELRLARGKTNGLTPAALSRVDIQTGALGPVVTDAFRVVAVNIRLTGASDINDGEVSVNIATVEQARIVRQTTAITTIMRCRARPGAFTVPVGFCALLDAWDFDSGPVVALQARPPRMPWQGVVGHSEKDFNASESSEHEQPNPMSFEAGTDLRLVYEEIAGGPPATTYIAPTVNLYLFPSTETTDPNPEQIPNLGRCTLGPD
jgi:hypothetical protein